MAGFAAVDALAFLFGGVEGDAADGGLGFFLDALLGLLGAVPMAEEEAVLLDLDLEVVPGVDLAGHAGAEVGGFLEEVLLYLLHEVVDVVGDAFDGHSDLLERVAAADLAGSVLQVTGADGQAHGDAFELVLVELPAGLVLGSVVILHHQAFGFEGADDGGDMLVELALLFVALADGDDGHVDGGQVRREDESVVVGVGHDEGAHEAGADAPRGGPYVFELVLLVEELHLEGLGEVLAQEVAGACLQSLAVLHHSLNAEGVEGAGEALVGALVTLEHGYGHVFLHKLGVDLEHAACLLLGLLAGGVGGVAFLPEKLSGAEEHAGAHLPTHDVGPLVAEDRQVAVGLDPVLVGAPDDGLGGGAHDELLFELGAGVDDDAAAVGGVHEAVVGHHGALLGETLDMLGLAAEEALGDEEGEIGVLVAGLFEHLVELVLHLLPDGIAIGFDDHASADGALLGEVGTHDEFVIPFGVVLATFWKIFCH